MKTFQDLLAYKEYVYLVSIADGGEQTLRARLCLGGHKALPRPIIGRKVEDLLAKPIQYTNADYVELNWTRYLQFTVCDESVAALLAGQHYEGKCVRRFTESRLLGRLTEISNGSHVVRKKPVQHFGLYCMNHIVDVLAYEEPGVVDFGSRPFSFGQPLKAQSTPRQP